RNIYLVTCCSSRASTSITAGHHYCYFISIGKGAGCKGCICLSCYWVAIDHPLVGWCCSSIGRCCCECDAATGTDRRRCRHDRYRWCLSSQVHHYLVTVRCRCSDTICIACHHYCYNIIISKGR